MHLDETVLQSQTTINLVEFIDELIEKIGPRIDKGNYQEIKRNYIEIKKLHNKAMARRSMKYRKGDK